MKKYLFYFLLAVCSGHISFAYQGALQLFLQAEKEKKYHDYEIMTDLFSQVDMDNKQLLKAIRVDISKVSSQINKAQKYNFDFSHLKQKKRDLRSFYHYVRSSKYCQRAIQLHNYIAEKYKHALRNFNVVKDLQNNPEKFHVQDRKNKLLDFVKMLKRDYAKLNRIEDLLHGDHGILKAKNHVYKVELVNIRNHFLYDDDYRIEYRYRRKPFKTFLFPATVVGAAGLAIYSVPCLLVAGFASIMTIVL